MSDPITLYQQHNVMSDPGPYANLFAELPKDLPGLHQIVQNVLIHVWKIRKNIPELLETRSNEIETRTTCSLLEGVLRLDASPLTVKRSADKRLIVDCRHFAAMLCAMLRHQGIPARVRNGFATYLEKTHFQDHWVCEYWKADEGRWVLEDPDLLMHDIPRDQFMVAGQAWQTCRAGKDDANRYGYGGEWMGLWTIRENLVRDLAALNKAEEMSLASWGLTRKPFETMSPEELALLDEVAALTAATDNVPFDAMRKIYQETPSLCVPPIVEIFNYISNKNSTLTI